MPTREWISNEFVLPEEVTDVAGMFNWDYVPYLIGVALAIDDPQVKEVDAMKAAQIGWTFFLIGFIFKHIDVDPCAIVAMFAKEGDARTFSDEKLVPCIEATPAVRDKVDVTTSRASGNRALFKKFPGGFVKLVGSNSPGSVKSTPAKVVIVEEPDDANANVNDQGDAISLLWERTKRKRNLKRIMGGTPSLKGLSRIEEHIAASDARVLPVVCHDCGQAHSLDFDNVSWLDIEEDQREHEIYGRADPDTAVYSCPHCGAVWDDYQRKKNIRDTVYNALAAGDKYAGWTPTREFHGAAGFKELNELYVCLPGATIADMVRDHLKAEHKASLGDDRERIVFVNSKLGRTYEYKDKQADAEQLREVARDYPELIIPRGGLMVTAGVDVQHNRLAVIIRAHGRDGEKWLIYWGELAAQNTCVDKNDAAWKELDKLLFGKFESEDGWLTEISAISIDASDGQTSDAVYDWVRSRSKEHRQILIMAIKGSSSQTDPEIFSTPRAKSIDHKNPKKSTKADRHGVKVYIVGTNKGKDFVTGQLKLEAEGHGRFHFYKTVRADYYDQVTSEVKAPHRSVRNRLVYQLKSGARNEGLDGEVYCEHAARAKRLHLLSPQQWDDIEHRLKQTDMFANKTDAVTPSKQTQPKPQEQAGRAEGGGFVNTHDNWMKR